MTDLVTMQRLFAEYGVTLTEPQYEKLREYAEILTQENNRQNLTRVTEPEEIWTRHFLDSAYLQRFIPEAGTVLDLGTGGGIPGIPLAVLCDSLSFVLLDSEQSKTEFVASAAKKLGLSVTVLCGRGEELAHGDLRGSFSCVISRAMAAGSMLAEIGIPFLKTGGSLLAMKGKHYDESHERFASAAVSLRCSAPEHFLYELAGEEKRIVRLVKTEETDVRFPRRFAKMKRAPL